MKKILATALLLSAVYNPICHAGVNNDDRDAGVIAAVLAYASPKVRSHFAKADGVWKNTSDASPFILEGQSCSPADQLWSNLRQQTRSTNIDVSVLDSFQQRNSNVARLPQLTVNENIIILGPEVAQTTDDELAKKYPNNRGSGCVSLPGYSSTGTDAVVYFEYVSRGGREVSQGFLSLHLEQEHWIVQEWLYQRGT